MNNAEKFKQIFGLYATELWSMPEGDFLEWLNRDVETTQIDHTADIGKKVSIPCGHENDLIFRQAAIDALARMMPRSYTPDGSHPADEEIFRAQEVIADCIEALEILTPAQPDNQTNLCDSCDCSYPDCPSKYDDVIFGNGIGNDNICACNKYKPSAQPETRWIPCSERFPEYNESVLTWDGYVFCIEKRIPYIRDDDGEPIEGDWWVGDEYDEYESECYPNLRDGAAIAWMPLPEPYRGGEK